MQPNRRPAERSLATAPVVLALDVDGVLLDASRGGAGSWKTTLGERFGITPDALADAFFARHWADVVTGRAAIRPLLAAALTEIGSDEAADVVLAHWLATDFVVDHAAVGAVTRWTDAGVPIVLATNQEHERAAYLFTRLGRLLPLSGIAHSAALGVTKDDPDFYTRARRHLGITDDAAVVFVDDTIGNVHTATEAGWHAVWCGGDTTWCDEVDRLLAGFGALRQ